jgi:hypothetical protein
MQIPLSQTVTLNSEPNEIHSYSSASFLHQGSDFFLLLTQHFFAAHPILAIICDDESLHNKPLMLVDLHLSEHHLTANKTKFRLMSLLSRKQIGNRKKDPPNP